MKSATLSIKIDPKVKAQAQQFAQDVGVPLGSLVNSFLKDTIRKQEITFSARDVKEFPPEPMTPQMEKSIERAEKEREEGYVSPGFANMEEFDAWLNNPESTWQNGRKIREDLS
jgi:addiction module RelB/DinJ family antitoxin